MNQHVKPAALAVVSASKIPSGVFNLETILDEAEALSSALALALDAARTERINIDEDKKWDALAHLADGARFRLRDAKEEWASAWKELGGVG